MLTLAILRHAKSSWNDPIQQDFDRPLNERGLAAAPHAGAALARFALNPTLILCSSAVRTRQTLKLVLEAMAMEKPPQIEFEEELYLASPAALMERVQGVEPAHQRALLVGHNPGLHALALSLAGHGPTPALEALNARFPTAALAVLTFDRARWCEIKPGDGTLALFWTPKTGAAASG